MTNKKSISTNKTLSQKRWKTWGLVALGVVLILVTFRLALRSNWARNYVKTTIEESVNRSLNAELVIESLEGDLYKQITLQGIKLNDNHGESIIELDSVFARYQIWSLLKFKLDVNEISLFSPKVHLIQQADSTWNIQHLIPPSDENVSTNERNRFLVHILDFSIHNGLADFQLNATPDDKIELANIELASSFKLLEDGFEAELAKFELVVRDHRLREELNVNMGATYQEGSITLDKLVMFTGSSLVNLVGNFMDDGSNIDLNAAVEPLSWQDIAAVSGEPFLVQDVNIKAGLSGSLQQLNLNFGVSAVGIEGIQLDMELSIDPEIEIRTLLLTSGSLDLPLLTGDTDMPSFEGIIFESDGLFALNKYKETDLKGKLSVKNPIYLQYRLSDFDMEFALKNGELSLRNIAQLGNQRIDIQLDASSIFDIPEWHIVLNSDQINPGLWASDQTLNGTAQFSIHGNGFGIEPGSRPWEIRGTFNEIELYDQVVTNSELLISLTQNDVQFEGSTKLGESNVKLASTIQNWMDDSPLYDYDIETQNFNIAEVFEIEDFVTSINLNLTGSGSGFEPSTTNQVASLKVFNSVINGARLDSLTAQISVKDQLMTVTESVLNSEFATADLKLTHSLIDFGDINNRLDFKLNVKDIGALAPLANVDVLKASGSINGTLRTPFGVTELSITTELTDILVDTISIASYTMKTDISGSDTYAFQTDTRFGEIIFGEHIINDLWIRSSGDIDSTNVIGEHRITLEKTDSTSLTTYAKFSYLDEVLQLNTSMLQIKTKDKQLDLYRPFNLIYENSLVRIDPVYLRGSTGVELTFGFEQTGQQAYNGFVNARDLDLTILQMMVLDEVKFHGNLSGEIDFDLDFDQEIYRSTSEITLTNVNYEGFFVDEIQLGTRLMDHRLVTRLRAINSEMPLVTLDLDVPFLPGDPIEFDESFFEQPIVGHFEFHELNLGEQPDFLSNIGFTGTKGLLSAKMDISGVAGSPKFIGELTFGEGMLSGVPIDHFDFGWQYHQDQNNLALTSRIISSGQEVASMTGTCPFNIDWRTFNPVELEEDAEVDLTIKTSSFNLTAINQFLDQTAFRNLQGILNMDMKLTGPIMSPKPTGNLQLTNGNLMVVENNITLRNIQSRINFDRDVIRLQNFSFRSDGELRATGQLEMVGYRPGAVDLSVTARNVKLYDTREIQAFVSVNAGLTGNFEAPVLKGGVTIDRGFIYMSNFGERTVEDIQLDDDEVSTFDGMELWKNTTVEMNLGTTRNFWVRNRSNPEIQLQLNGELDLVKSQGRDLEVFGRMGVNDGYVMQLGKRFTFDRGEVVFSGVPTNPDLDIRTLYALRQPSDIKIWYVIGGTAEEPTFSYDSDPEMELQDIVSYTVFGRPFHSLMAWEQTITGRSESAVADAAVDILLDRVEQLATDRLGIDLLQIENTRASGNTGTTIKAGKFVSDRLFVALLQELGNNPLSMIIIEYELKRDLELILTGSDSYHNGIDIRWKYDY